MRGAALNLSNMENLEVTTGKAWVEDGPYSGPVVNSQRQLSSFVRADLTTGKTYRVRLAHDARSINMSGFSHFESYTGGTGGRGGAFFRANVAEIKLLSLGR